ncbi:hypothetical protein VMCG_01675 [Cytospora schulzeri]|uniref:Uncharacterized protein n=1 Tax=Cytospora schulzeri TaxID=448051 RepID=A0A423X2W6_9PEZI|nr:hypothetical protein VMCG_01675 [Valsa malicola]
MWAAALRVGLPSLVVFLVSVAAARPEHDVELDARSALPQPSWKDVGLLPFGGLSNAEENDEIDRPVPRTSTVLEVADAASTNAQTGYWSHVYPLSLAPVSHIAPSLGIATPSSGHVIKMGDSELALTTASGGSYDTTSSSSEYSTSSHTYGGGSSSFSLTSSGGGYTSKPRTSLISRDTTSRTNTHESSSRHLTSSSKKRSTKTPVSVITTLAITTTTSTSTKVVLTNLSMPAGMSLTTATVLNGTAGLSTSFTLMNTFSTNGSA